MPRPDVDVSVRQVLSPVTRCQPGMEQVTVVIRNEGKDTLTSVPVRYLVAGAGAPVQETLADTLFPDSSMVYVFNTLVNMQVTGSDSLFHITVYTDHPADTFPHNDTLHIAVMAGSIPADPVPQHRTIPYGTATTLTALSADTLFWYAHPSGGPPCWWAIA
jgi:hypothetical protein